MGEIDTKSIESVKAALSLFGEKSDHVYRRNQSTSSNLQLEGLIKELSNFKIQLEVKDSSHKQALLDIDNYQKTADELFILLKISEFERDIYMNECKEARMLVDELESKMNEMTDQLFETMKFREQLSHVTSELKSMNGELLDMETELAAARETKLEAITQAELMETALKMENAKIEELLRHVTELNETVLHLKLAATEGEKEKCAILSEKEAELQLAAEAIVEAEEQLEFIKKQLEIMQNLENQLSEKSSLVVSLQLELKQAKECYILAEKAVSDAVEHTNRLQADLEELEIKNLDQARYIDMLDLDLDQLRAELNAAKEEIHCLNCDVETMTEELEKMKNDLGEISGRETEGQIEIALLKSELHKGRSKVAAAQATEERVKSEKSGLYLALQQLALEVDEANKENRRLKEEASREAEPKSENRVIVDLHYENSSQDDEVHQSNESLTEAKERGEDIVTNITISMEEYEALVKRAEKADQVPEPLPEYQMELDILKKELEIATAKTREFRVRAEQAVSRAEVAERAKAGLDEQIRRWREQKERRKATLAALQEEVITSASYSFKYDDASKPYQPLGKVLNMKF